MFLIDSIFFVFLLNIVVVVVVVNAGTNKQHTAPKNTAKLDREHEELKHKQVSHSVSKLIMQGRQAKGLSQKDLATVSSL